MRGVSYAEEEDEPDEPLGANLAICSNQIADRYDCLAVTLEMPFKDCATSLAAGFTFQGPRAAALGGSLLDALAHVASSLRGVDSPQFGAEDGYVAPLEDADSVAAFVREQEKFAALAVSGSAVSPFSWAAKARTAC